MNGTKEKRQKTDAGKTIHSQILKGYFVLTGVMVVLVCLSIIFLWVIQIESWRIEDYQSERYNAQGVISAHYKWLEQLLDSITTGSEFEGSLDPENCALGNWLKTSREELSGDMVMKEALDDLIEPHEDIHLTAQELVDLSKTDKDAAYEEYGTEFKPKVEIIGSCLTKISDRYKETIDRLRDRGRFLTVLSNVLLVLSGLMAVILSVRTGKRLSDRIASPIVAADRWLEQLSMGVDNLELDEANLNETHMPVEIKNMVDSFHKMRESIENNVSVIKRVANGDLTAYVDIRSDGDSLGQNLYHLVQNNDFTFANLLHVADEVASNAEHIANANQTLAEGATTQAGAVDVLAGMIKRANELAVENASGSAEASTLISAMSADVREEHEEMLALRRSVEEIQEASQRISVVMDTLNDLAYRTNILALNTAVEAARAGEAGRSFAVVADEVRKLATESARSAAESAALVQDTIEKTREGGEISRKATEQLNQIVDLAGRITAMMNGINGASDEQQKYMGQINGEIDRISQAVVDNAAISQETAAATQQMNANADYIREEMYKFNLRKREEGKPYIPPEKSDDAEFAKVANENYQKMLAKTTRSHA